MRYFASRIKILLKFSFSFICMKREKQTLKKVQRTKPTATGNREKRVMHKENGITMKRRAFIIVVAAIVMLPFHHHSHHQCLSYTATRQ